ncbi:Clavaminate synthase-like protein [Hymenopellis radicata]|nr:Clavaminate synthase-like protein [Hymenopellis radicata]
MSPLTPLSANFQRTLPSPPFPETLLFPGIYGPPSSRDNSENLLGDVPSGSEFKALLKAHGGAVIFRGFGVETAEDFSRFGFATKVGPPHDEVGRPPLRTIYAENVVTANEGPPTAPIWHHNEYGWSTVHPAYLSFFCLVRPTSGGETPLNSSVELLHRLSEEVPEFVAELKKRGVLYAYRYGKVTVKTSNTGASFVVPDDSPEVIRQKVEEQVRRHSNRFEWHDNGDLTVWHHVPSASYPNTSCTGLPVFFGNLISAYGRSKHHKALEPPFLGDDGGYHPLPTHGDGGVIPVEWMEIADRIVHETRALVKWDKGDVVVFDNHAVQHAREPWTGERKVLASLWDGEKFPDKSPFLS